MPFRCTLVLALGAMAVFAEKQASSEKTPAQNERASKAAPNTTTELPKGAVEISAGVYKFTDSSGKTWIYRKTPFGLSKSPETPDVNAFEDGENVRFERLTPFGVSKWTRKKTELTKEEQEIWDRSKTPKIEDTGTKATGTK